MKYVVTGGAGFIGSHIVKFLVEKKHTVSVIDNLHVGTKKRLESAIGKIDFYQTDILNFNEVEQIVQKSDGVFHQAALTSLPESFEKPEEYYNVNVNGTENIFLSNPNKVFHSLALFSQLQVKAYSFPFFLSSVFLSSLKFKIVSISFPLSTFMP